MTKMVVRGFLSFISIAMILMTGCNAPTKADKIIVATSPGYEPFEYKEGEELVGYEIDIWKEFEKRTGTKVEWEFADFSGLLGLLQSGKADVVSAQMTPNEERLKTFDFTEPISYTGYVVVVSEDNEEIKGFDDLAGKKIGIGSGANVQKMVEEKYPDGQVTIENYTSATLENQYADLSYGRIDAVIAQDVQIYQAIKNGGVKCKVLQPAFDSNPGCFVVSKGSPLEDTLNTFIAEIRDDGTLFKISNKWIGSDITNESK